MSPIPGDLHPPTTKSRLRSLRAGMDEVTKILVELLPLCPHEEERVRRRLEIALADVGSVIHIVRQLEKDNRTPDNEQPPFRINEEHHWPLPDE